MPRGYRSGQITEKQLIEIAGSTERDKSEVYWAIGFRKLALGDRQGAQASLNEIAHSPLYVWSTVMWARAFTERMDQDPNWPDWLPIAPVEDEAE